MVVLAVGLFSMARFTSRSRPVCVVSSRVCRCCSRSIGIARAVGRTATADALNGGDRGLLAFARVFLGINHRPGRFRRLDRLARLLGNALHAIHHRAHRIAEVLLQAARVDQRIAFVESVGESLADVRESLTHPIRGFVQLRREQIAARAAIVLPGFAESLRRVAHGLRALADRVADQRDVLEQIEQLRDAFEQQRDEPLGDADERLAHADPEIRRGENLKERDGVLHRLDQVLPQRLRHGHQRAREEVHRVGEGDLRRGEKDVADLPIRERLNDEGHGFAGLLTPAREVEIGKAVEQRLEHRRDLVGEADPEAAHLRARERELVADVIEERRVAGKELRLGADLVRGIAKAVRRKEREQLGTAASEQLHRNRRALATDRARC